MLDLIVTTLLLWGFQRIFYFTYYSSTTAVLVLYNIFLIQPHVMYDVRIHTLPSIALLKKLYLQMKHEFPFFVIMVAVDHEVDFIHFLILFSNFGLDRR